MTAKELRGDAIAATARTAVAERVAAVRDAGHAPTLGTVLMSDDPAAERFMDLKHDTCDDLGIETRDRRISPEAPASTLTETVAALSDDSAVDAVFVQTPLPTHVEWGGFRRALDPVKDVDCFHPENVGRLVTETPRYVPATTAAVCRILAHYDIRVAGRHVVIVGRSNAIGKPLANRLLWDAEPGNATVTVCHSKTVDLGAITRRADILVTACGVPELIDGTMLAEGATVIDVSANRRADGETSTIVGDVDYESARGKASAITPVPGGVGPMTLAALLENVVTAAEHRA